MMFIDDLVEPVLQARQTVFWGFSGFYVSSCLNKYDSTDRYLIQIFYFRLFHCCFCVFIKYTTNHVVIISKKSQVSTNYFHFFKSLRPP